VPRQGANLPETAELRAFLQQSLPMAMLPGHIFQVEKIPLTANGKRDREALLATHPLQLGAGREYVAPADEMERELARIWGEILGLERVSVTDDFLELGGQSLSAMTLMTHINQSFEVELPLKVVFEGKTIRALSREIQLAQIETADDDEVAALIEEMEGLSQEEIRALLTE